MRAVGNNHLPRRLEQGGSVTYQTMERIKEYAQAEAKRRQGVSS
jgi:hypothetical protein